MPKIPLYNSGAKIGTAKGVSIDPSVGLEYVQAQDANRQALTDGAFKIMQETIGAGSEFLKQREENRIKANAHSFTLMKSDMGMKIEEERIKGQQAGLDEQETYNQKIKPYLTNALTEWEKEDNSNFITRDIEEQYEIQKDELSRKEVLKVVAIENTKNADKAFKVAQITYNKGDAESFKIADEQIDGIVGITTTEKAKYKRQGRINSFELDIANAESVNDIDNIAKRVDEQLTNKEIPLDVDIGIDVKRSLKTRRKELYQEVSKPARNRLRVKIATNTFNESDPDFQLLDEIDQEEVRAQYAIKAYQDATADEKTVSSNARSSLKGDVRNGTLTLNDKNQLVNDKGIVDERNYQLLDLDKQALIYESKTIEEDRKQIEERNLSTEENKRRTNLISEIENDIKNARFDVNRDERLNNPLLSKQDREELIGLVEDRQTEIIVRSETVAAEDDSVTLGYNKVYEMVYNFSIAQDEDGNNLTIKKLAELHQDILDELKSTRPTPTGKTGTELNYPPDVANRILDQIGNIRNELGELTLQGLKVKNPTSIEEIKTNAFIAVHEAFRGLELDPTETATRAQAFATFYDEYFDIIEDVFKKPQKYTNKDGQQILTKNEDGSFSGGREIILHIVEKATAKVRRAKVGLMLRQSFIGQQIMPVNKTDEQVVNETLQRNLSR
tara:strand:+ start:2905 stop:4923 length:2019 start_codon:yes stop_codon:yes gene_type:complete